MQDPSEWKRSPDRRAKDLFLEALERPPVEREAFLASAAGGDRSLAQAVRGLLAGHDQAAEWVRTQAPTSLPASAPASGPAFGPQAGDRIGPFELAEEIGHGGFGVVWRAVQHGSLHREVALKVLKAGVDTREVVRRFEAERQALARMDHPGIARVFDGGATVEGRPWFAMELVGGAAITSHCARHELSVESRLELFVDVCRAVQHAHAKGVVHRDLKPSNVLVSEVDGRSAVKVIDFGIAKAIGERLTDDSLRTRAGAFLGTPAYMSPEQLEASDDVDTRADVYSLGILLYEMLVGTTPFDPSTGPTPGSADLLELRRRVREEDPERPSDRLARHPAANDGLRSNGLQALRRRLRGDLDWIVLRCLAKDREQRYESPAILANEIERHLRGEAVLAGPPTTLYRVGKFIRRHRKALATLVLVLLLSVTGAVVATDQALRARRAERAQATETARARLELQRAEATAAFLESLLLSIEPESARGMDLTLLRAVLARASRNMDQLGVESPVVEAALRRILGGAYAAILDFERAERELARALELRESELGPDDPKTLQSMHELGGLYLERRRPADAEPLVWGAWEGRRRLLGPDDPVTLSSLSNLAGVRMQLGQHERALELWIELERHPTPGDPEHGLLVANNLATTLAHLGRGEEALERFLHVLDEQRRLHDEEHPETLATMTNVAGQLEALGRDEEARVLLVDALAIKRRILAPDHPSRIIGANNLARLLTKMGREEEAEAQYLEALEAARERGAAKDPYVLRLAGNLATLWLEQQRHEDAEALLREVLAGWVDAGADRHLRPLWLSALAEALLRQGRSEEAVEPARQAFEALETLESAPLRTRAIVRVRLGEALLALERGPEAGAVLAGVPELGETEPADLRRRVEEARTRAE